MQALLLKAVAFVFVLGILIFVHEFGHYAVAKFFKVRVETFSLGFGKRLIGFRRGDTDYRISILPLGGYVKMAGENPMEERTGDPGEFMSHPRWQRFLIAIAGPAMNVILAVAVLTGVYMVHHQYPAYLDQPAQLGWVAVDSPAQKAGFQTGDKIVAAQGKDKPTWDDIRYKILGRINQNLEMDVQRGDQSLHLGLPVSIPEKGDVDILSNLGLTPEAPSIVGRVDRDTPAEKAGMQVGDEVLAVNGIKVQSSSAVGLAEVLQKNKDNPARITISRKGQPLELTITPRLLPGPPTGKEAYRIGVGMTMNFRTEKLPFAAAFNAATVDCKKNSTLIFTLLGQLFTVKGTLKQFGGPVMIFTESGKALEAGFIVLLEFMSLISLNLAIFNLLPIPILDGGLVLMLLVESVMRRDIKQEVKERVYQVAFVFLVLFAAVVIYNDVVKTLPTKTHAVQ